METNHATYLDGALLATSSARCVSATYHSPTFTLFTVSYLFMKWWFFSFAYLGLCFLSLVKLQTQEVTTSKQPKKIIIFKCRCQKKIFLLHHRQDHRISVVHLPTGHKVSKFVTEILVLRQRRGVLCYHLGEHFEVSLAVWVWEHSRR